MLGLLIHNAPWRFGWRVNAWRCWKYCVNFAHPMESVTLFVCKEIGFLSFTTFSGVMNGN